MAVAYLVDNTLNPAMTAYSVELDAVMVAAGFTRCSAYFDLNWVANTSGSPYAHYIYQFTDTLPTPWYLQIDVANGAGGGPPPPNGKFTFTTGSGVNFAFSPGTISTAASSAVVTGAGTTFASGDVGKVLFSQATAQNTSLLVNNVAGSAYYVNGGSLLTYLGYISSWTSATSVTMAANTPLVLTSGTFSSTALTTGIGTVAISAANPGVITGTNTVFDSTYVGRAVFTGSLAAPVFQGIISSVASATSATFTAGLATGVAAGATYFITPVLASTIGAAITGAGTGGYAEFLKPAAATGESYFVAYQSGVMFMSADNGGAHGLFGIERARDFQGNTQDDIVLWDELAAAPALPIGYSLTRNTISGETVKSPTLTLVQDSSTVPPALPASTLLAPLGVGSAVVIGPYFTSGGVRGTPRLFAYITNGDFTVRGVDHPVTQDGVVRQFRVPVNTGAVSTRLHGALIAKM